MRPVFMVGAVQDPRTATAVFLILFAVFFCGCRKDAASASFTPASVEPSPPGSIGRAAEAAAVSRLAQNFARVHFEFDSAQLTNVGAALLDENAQILARYPGLVVEIQGHTDPRGSTSYNLALGSQRALSARHRLMVRGIASDRLMTVTYGEERPLSKGDDAPSLARNRRVEFRVVQGQSPQVVGTVQ